MARINATRQSQSNKPTRLSISALERFQRCPWIFYVADVLQRPVPVYNPHASLGALVHHVIEGYHRNGPLFPMSEAQLIDRYHAAWDKQMPIGLYASPEAAEQDKADGETMLRRFFHDQMDRDQIQKPILIETGFRIPLRSDILLTGRIDRVDSLHLTGGYHVIDYKTSRRPMNHLLQPEDSLQLGLYALATQSLLGHYPEQLGLYYLAHGVLLETAFDSAQVETTLSAFHTVANALDSGEFSPQPEPHKCGHCAYQPQCPVFHPQLLL